MKKNRFYEIFKKGSKTYFYNSIFFPAKVRDDVFILYSFVRVADNLVDAVPQRKDDFCKFQEDFCRSWDGEVIGDEVLDCFTNLAHRKKFEKDWVEAFLHSMELDLTKSTYDTLAEVEEYIYGSAEVVGLMMSKVLGVDEGFFKHARSLGKAMQYINFIRDIEEDNHLGRRYLPTEEIEKAGLRGLKFKEIENDKDAFRRFIRSQLDRYEIWQTEAEKGFNGLERRYRIPVMNASDMYNWTAGKIRKDPMVVYRKKVKPSKVRIVGNLIGKKLSI